MPIYEYKCSNCSKDATAIRPVVERKDDLPCECGSYMTLMCSAPSTAQFDVAVPIKPLRK